LKYILSIIILLLVSFDLLSQEINELNILCWDGYASKKHTQRFEKMIKEKYTIDLKINVLNVSNPSEFFNMIRSKEVDLISPAHNLPKSERWPFISGPITLPLNLSNIPNYNNIIKKLQHSDFVSYKNKVYAVPIVYGPYGLAYNSSKISAPKSWNAFWQAEYINQYAISADYNEANIYITAMAMGLSEKRKTNV